MARSVGGLLARVSVGALLLGTAAPGVTFAQTAVQTDTATQPGIAPADTAPSGAAASGPSGAAGSAPSGAAASAPSLASSPQSAPSQTTASPQPSDQANADIIVTAQFRSQRLQDTPLAITAISAADLAQRNQTSVVDLAGNAPNITILKGGSGYGLTPTISIRGVGAGDYNFALSPAVGVYLDDVYMPTLFGSASDLVDIDRVEVLRGPQGTLSGKNSVGGAIKIFSKAPSNEFGGSIEGGYGNFNTVRVRGAINIPIVKDTLALRITGAFSREDGYLTKVDYGCRFPNSGIAATTTASNCVIGKEGGTNHRGIRGQLRWTPTAALQVDLSADYTKIDDQPAATKLTYARNPQNIPQTDFAQFLTRQPFVNYATNCVTELGYCQPAVAQSDPTGRTIVHASAGNLKKVQLELGGKGANIVFADANIQAAVGGAAFAIFHNQGQACIAGSRLIIHEDVVDEFLDRFVALARSIRLGDPLDPETEMGPLTSRLHQQRVLSYVEVAREQGGEVITGGRHPEGAAFAKGCFVEPTIVRAKPTDRVAQEEVFGPFVTVLTFCTDEEALEIANGTQYGLGAGLWTNDLTRAHRVAKRLHAGMVWINCYKRVHPGSPFGGMGQSGYGREMGFEAMREYTVPKSVWVNVDAQIPPFYRR